MKKLLIVLLLLLFAVPCFGTTLTFTWTANTEPDLAGYNLYRNGSYVQTLQADATTCTAESENGLGVWYLTAFDDSGNESDRSDVAVHVEDTGSHDTSAPGRILQFIISLFQ